MIDQHYFWNTTKNFHEYPDLIKKIFIKVNKQERSSFSKWVGEIGKKNENDIDWWSTPLTSRNPNVTKIFKNICLVETIKILHRKKINCEIIVDSKDLLHTINKVIRKSNKIKATLLQENKYFNNAYLLFKCIIFYLLSVSFIKLFIPKKNQINNDVNLIYTYPSLIPNKHERLFQIPKNKIKEFSKKTLFIPSFIITPQIVKIFYLIKKISKKNYFFKEHIISYKDLFYSILHFKRIKKFNVKYKLYKNVDYSNSIFNEINSFVGVFTRTTCILNYLFVKKITQNNIKIKKTICWLENQPEKCWTYAFRKYSPKTMTYGYQGYTDLPQLMNTIPSEHEVKAKIIPKKIIIINKNYNRVRKEFYKKLNTCVGPALIYQNIFKQKENLANKKIDILLVLGEFPSINEGLLKWIIEIQNKLIKYNILIKKPKILKVDNLPEIKKLEQNINLTNDNLSDLMRKSRILISSGPTAASIEGLVYGCYLINPLLEPFDPFVINNLKVSKKNYFVAKNYDELLKVIVNFLSNYKTLKKNMAKSEKLKKFFFTKANNKNLRYFL